MDAELFRKFTLFAGSCVRETVRSAHVPQGHDQHLLLLESCRE